jgi:hypothetical protein
MNSAAVARGARTQEGSKMENMTTGMTRGQRARGEKPVLNDDALYLTDNGRCLCGKHCGNSARYTGRDISGQKVARLTANDIIESIRVYKWEPECESCGRKLSLVEVA